MSMRWRSISVVSSFDPAFIRRVRAEGEQARDVALRDVLFLGADAGDRVEVGQADVLHIRRGELFQPLLHAVGEDAHHAQHLSARFAQRVNRVDDAAAGGDEILDDHDLLAAVQTALDAVFAAVILIAGADIAHRQTQQVGGDGGVGDTGGGGTHEHLGLRIFAADGVGDGCTFASLLKYLEP